MFSQWTSLDQDSPRTPVLAENRLTSRRAFFLRNLHNWWVQRRQTVRQPVAAYQTIVSFNVYDRCATDVWDSWASILILNWQLHMLFSSHLLALSFCRRLNRGHDVLMKVLLWNTVRFTIKFTVNLTVLKPRANNCTSTRSRLADRLSRSTWKFYKKVLQRSSTKKFYAIWRVLLCRHCLIWKIIIRRTIHFCRFNLNWIALLLRMIRAWSSAEHF